MDTSRSAERRLRVMGTQAHVVVHAAEPERVAAAAVDNLHLLERIWSRFVPDSEVSRMNRNAGDAVAVSGETILLVERSIEAWTLTGGRYDPAMLAQVCALGYDRSFDEIGPVDRLAAPQAPSPGCGGIAVDRQRGTATLPAGVAFDPGGIGKGLAADLVSGWALDAGADGVMVNVGGDLRVRGVPPDGDRWVIAVREPAWSDDAISTLHLGDGAVATSTSLRRRWVVSGVEHHHLLDPRSGCPHQGGAVLATAVATEGWWAEAAATASIGSGFVDECPMLRIDADGRTARLGGYERYES